MGTTEISEIQKKNLYWEGGQTLNKVGQVDTGVALNGNIQYLTGQCPEQPAVVADPT